jgi:hypothetical protein
MSDVITITLKPDREISDLGCMLGIFDACVQPASFVKLVEEVPFGWAKDTLPASLGFYCSLEHAAAEPTADLDDARQNFAEIFDSENAFDNDLRLLWSRLIEHYPAVIHINIAPTLPDPDDQDARAWNTDLLDGAGEED